jgi:orotidine-5'-phosphate decarboxylase
MRRNSRLILALDVTEKAKAVEVANQVYDLVDAIKVNYPIVLSCGMGIVKELAGINDVICDFKVADVPNTNRLIVEQVVKAGASGVICQGFVGKDSIEACVKAAEGIDVYVVVEMSHPGSEDFIKSHVENMTKQAIEVGASGIIAPGTRPERISILREIVGDRLILAPGIGAQGGSASEAIKAGADYVIVGRTIYMAEDPKAAVEGIIQEIDSAGDR